MSGQLLIVPSPAGGQLERGSAPNALDGKALLKEQHPDLLLSRPVSLHLRDTYIYKSLERTDLWAVAELSILNSAHSAELWEQEINIFRFEDAMSNPHVLLTGANGFIASHILGHLIKARRDTLFPV